MKKLLCLLLMLLMLPHSMAHAADDISVHIKSSGKDNFKVEVINNSKQDLHDVNMTVHLSDDMKITKNPDKIAKLAKGEKKEFKFQVKKPQPTTKEVVSTEKSSDYFQLIKDNIIYVGIGAGALLLVIIGIVIKVKKAKQVLLIFLAVGGLLSGKNSALAIDSNYHDDIMLFDKKVTVTVKLDYASTAKENTSSKKRVITAKSKKNEVAKQPTQQRPQVAKQPENTPNQVAKAPAVQLQQAENVQEAEQPKATAKEQTNVAEQPQATETEQPKAVEKEQGNVVEVSKATDKVTEQTTTSNNNEVKQEQAVIETADFKFSNEDIEKMKNPDVSKKYLEKYKNVYGDIIKSYKDNYEDDTKYRNFLDGYFDDKNYDIVYSLVDLNKDDVPELIVVGHKDNMYIIDNIYSQQNEVKSIFADKSFFILGRRTNVDLYQSGIWSFGSGGAGRHGMTRFVLASNNKVKEIDRYDQDRDNYTKNDAPITQSEYEQEKNILENERIDLSQLNWHSALNE